MRHGNRRSWGAAALVAAAALLGAGGARAETVQMWATIDVAQESPPSSGT